MLDTKKHIVQLVLVKLMLLPRVLLQNHLITNSPMLLQVETSACDLSEDKSMKR